MESAPSRYVLKPDPHSSHSVVLAWLGEGAGRRLLDVGAADGYLSGRFTGRGWRVTALERDPALATRAAARCERVVIADLNRAVPELDAPFDAIVCADILEHLIDPEGVLGELLRALQPGGTVVISVPNIAHLYVRLLLLVGRFDYIDRGILDHTHLRFFTERSLRALVTGAGLVIDRLTATPAPLYQLLPESWHRPWVAVTNAVNAFVASRARRLLGYQFIVQAHRKSDGVLA